MRESTMDRREEELRKLVKEREETRRAVHIAAVIMQAAGLCRYDDVGKCRRVYVTEKGCVDCIKKWLLNKARKEIGNV